MISEDHFKDILSKVVKSKEALIPASPFEPIGPLDKLTIGSLTVPFYKASGPLIIEEDQQRDYSVELKLKEAKEVKKANKAKDNMVIKLQEMFLSIC